MACHAHERIPETVILVGNSTIACSKVTIARNRHDSLLWLLG